MPWEKELPKIEIKLKGCCLTCPNFDERGILGLGFCYGVCDKRVIACGHMDVCWKYRESSEATTDELVREEG